MLSYAPSQPRKPHAREGSLLVVLRATPGGQNAAPLPKRCVKCGQPSTVLLDRTFSWHEPWIYVLLLPGVLFYAIVALVMRKQIRFAVPLCGTHAANRRNGILVAWLIALVGVASPFLLSALDLNVGLGILSLVFLLLAAAIVGTVAANSLRPTRIDDQRATFKGCGEEFLRLL